MQGCNQMSSLYKVSDNTIKLIQKQAVMEYYERQRRTGGRLPEAGADPLFSRSASQVLFCIQAFLLF